MNDRGWILRIEDGYHSLEMQGRLVRKPEVFDVILQKCIWENGGKFPPVELAFPRAIVLVANIPKIGAHVSGSAFNVSVFRHDDGAEVWCGNPDLGMCERTPMRSPFVEAEARHNRPEISAMIDAQRLVHFSFEFWHFNKGDALGHVLTNNGSPAWYGPVNWDPQTNLVVSVPGPLNSLNPMPVIEQEIAAAPKREKRRQFAGWSRATVCNGRGNSK